MAQVFSVENTSVENYSNAVLHFEIQLSFLHFMLVTESLVLEALP